MDTEAAFENGFEIAGGSVAGHAHLAAGRNNQDAFCWEASAGGLIAVVCDGCGSRPHSEVGALVGARLVVRALRRLRRAGLGQAGLFDDLRRSVLGGPSDGRRPRSHRTVVDYLLFTIVGLIVTDRCATPFSIGDGLIVVNGEAREIGPFPDNEPPYLAYALLPRGLDGGRSDRTAFQVHEATPAEALRSVLIGTDGVRDLRDAEGRPIPGRSEPEPEIVGPLSQFWTDDAFFRNRDMVRRRLAVLNRGPRAGLLADDTTLVAVRRKGLAP
jgi:hypothetical protein